MHGSLPKYIRMKHATHETRSSCACLFQVQHDSPIVSLHQLQVRMHTWWDRLAQHKRVKASHKSQQTYGSQLFGLSCHTCSHSDCSFACSCFSLLCSCTKLTYLEYDCTGDSWLGPGEAAAEVPLPVYDGPCRKATSPFSPIACLKRSIVWSLS